MIGSWNRAQACAEMLAAFDEAGLAESHRGWLQGNFYGGKPGPKRAIFARAEGPLEHDHFFTGDSAYGSHDQNGEEVDGGDFELVDGDTVSFPSHAEEFGYDGDLVVDYTVSGDVVTFRVALPDPCVETCAYAYAWHCPPSPPVRGSAVRYPCSKGLSPGTFPHTRAPRGST